RRREPQLHQRDQALAAGEQLRVVAGLGEHRYRLLDAQRAAELERRRDHVRSAFQTRSGESGISRWSTSSASHTAFTTAALAAIVPASPMPFAPSGLTGV